MEGKYVDRAKEQVLYEYADQEDSVRLMLQHGDVNSRVNEEMGRWIMAAGNMTKLMKGNWKNLLGSTVEDLQIQYLSLAGYSRVQAIEMRGMQSIAEREVLEKKERGGLMGLFQGK